ncbi:DUF2007 domain-containing protein [Echinicola sp. 20G]|uniref:DUF2007 domain-containing protein n=1 Tax=Echinicola sp. 20G TaxID=2781961 RepID=UPI00191106B7|nr:DUF2007 domain-containing protein [Echinicola sp. 20G]
MELITLETFDNAVEAHLLKSKLESEGIQVFLFDENTVTLNPMISEAIGGIKLKAFHNSFTSAVKVLNKYNDSPILNEEGEVLKCSHCGSHRLVSETSYFENGKGLLAMFISLILMVFPIYAKRGHRCIE